MRTFSVSMKPPASGCDSAARGLPANAGVQLPRTATASARPAATRRANLGRPESVRVCIDRSRYRDLSDRSLRRRGGCCRRSSALRRRRVPRRLGCRGTAEGCFRRTRRRLIDIPLERSEEAAADLGARECVRLERREALQALLRPRVIEPPPHQLEVLLVDRDRLVLERVRRVGELLFVVLERVWREPCRAL